MSVYKTGKHCINIYFLCYIFTERNDCTYINTEAFKIILAVVNTCMSECAFMFVSGTYFGNMNASMILCFENVE